MEWKTIHDQEHGRRIFCSDYYYVYNNLKDNVSKELLEKNMKKTVDFLILTGRKKVNSAPEEWVEEAREALVFDLVEKIKPVESIGRIIVSSNRESLLEGIREADERIVTDYFRAGGSFKFGNWLEEIVQKYQPERLFYWGGGASPLITREIIEGICASLLDGEKILYTNNFFSSDWVGFAPADAVLTMDPPPLDNNLAYYLWQKKAFRSIYIAPSVEIVGDIDTPTDLMVLAVHPGTSPRLKKYLQSLDMDLDRIHRLAGILKERNKIFLAGRVGSSLFKYLDSRCPCSFRIISEERGMRSFGRQGRREVKSILGKMIDSIGIDETISFIEQIADAAVIDSRVLFCHKIGHAKTADRFHSDLFMINRIEDEFVKEFTRKTSESKIPIILGGHSLILGGMWEMVSAFGELPAFY